MLQRSTIQLLRIPFSFFLLPVYLFAVSDVEELDGKHVLLIFFILHFLVYPSSNGYNSYMDRDSGSIGGVKKPLQPTIQLFRITLLLDLLAITLSLLLGWIFAAGLIFYILASRAYSARTIRLKKFPLAGYLVVVFFQGAVTYFLVYHGSSVDKTLQVPITGLLAGSLLIGGFYPLTQIYQHVADKQDGVTTISMLLGYRGTFVFTAFLYVIAMATLFYHFNASGQSDNFMILATVMLPVLVYFLYWAQLVWKNSSAADYTRAMRMNLLASLCTNMGFLILLTRRLI